jgi:hypothetical protein
LDVEIVEKVIFAGSLRLNRVPSLT